MNIQKWSIALAFFLPEHVVGLKNLPNLFVEYLFDPFSNLLTHFFININNLLQHLIGIGNIIPTEVSKLYPDAHLSNFNIKFRSKKINYAI